MIKGLAQELTPRAFERGSRPDKVAEKAGEKDREGSSSFADQLFGHKAEKLEAPNHNERKQPGREQKSVEQRTDSSREGKRSTERDADVEESSQRPRSEARAETRAEVRRKPKRSSPQDEAVDGRAAVMTDRPAERPIVKDLKENASSVNDSVKNDSVKSDVGVTIEDGVAARTSPKDAKMTTARELPVVNAENFPLRTGLDLQQPQLETRQGAMTDFVVKMQQELGVPPEKILQAFADLDAQDLMAPPEEAMESFLANLDLNPAQEMRAAKLYQDMVQLTDEADLGESLASMDAGPMEMLSPRDVVLNKLSKALDQMNEVFLPQDPAMKAQLAAEQMEAQIVRLNQDKLSTEKSAQNRKGDELLAGPALVGTPVGASAAASVGGAVALAAQPTVDASASASAPAPEASSNGSALRSIADMFGAAPSTGGAKPNLSNGGGSGQSMGKEADAQSTMAMQREFTSRMAANESSVGKGAFKKAVAETESVGADMAAPGSAAATDPSLAGLSGSQLAQPKMAGIVAGPSGMVIEGPKLTPQDEADNIREIVQQAQVALKRGGGEMKLEMKPEGMGQVHLRVSVENGQVNVQMMADNDAAKKILENGLDELKASLNAHKLHVESMKVDVSQDIKKQMDQNQQDSNREQARQVAQDFMGSFRQERESARQGFADSRAWRSYDRGPQRATVSAESVAVAQASARGSSDSKRLNLVA